jgi:hypothetical protein
MWKFFHGGLCSVHKSAKRVNIGRPSGRNSETENPIGTILLPVAEKKHQILK